MHIILYLFVLVLFSSLSVYFRIAFRLLLGHDAIM